MTYSNKLLNFNIILSTLYSVYRSNLKLLQCDLHNALKHLSGWCTKSVTQDLGHIQVLVLKTRWHSVMDKGKITFIHLYLYHFFTFKAFFNYIPILNSGCDIIDWMLI